MAAPVLALPDGGADDGGLEPGEGGFEQLVVARAGLAADGGEEMVRREPEEA